MVCLAWRRFAEARRYLRWAASILESMEDSAENEHLRPHLAILRYNQQPRSPRWEQ